MWHRVPVIVLFIGGSLLIQGTYTILYLHGELTRWGDLAAGAFFAGEGLSVCVGAAGLIEAILNNLGSSDIEIAPVLAGVLMSGQALLALLYLFVSDQLRPRYHPAAQLESRPTTISLRRVSNVGRSFHTL